MDKKNWYNIQYILVENIENKVSEKEITLPDLVPHADKQSTRIIKTKSNTALIISASL